MTTAKQLFHDDVYISLFGLNLLISAVISYPLHRLYGIPSVFPYSVGDSADLPL